LGIQVSLLGRSRDVKIASQLDRLSLTDLYAIARAIVELRSQPDIVSLSDLYSVNAAGIVIPRTETELLVLSDLFAVVRASINSRSHSDVIALTDQYLVNVYNAINYKTQADTVTLSANFARATTGAAAGIVGGHLSDISAWSIPTYADAAKQGRMLSAGTYTRYPDNDLDSLWQPTTDFRLLFIEGSGAGDTTLLAGTYSLRFVGQATISSNGTTTSGPTYDAGTNVTTATINFSTAGDGGLYHVEFTNAWRNAGHTADGTGNTRGVTQVSLMYPGHTWGTDYWRKEVVSMSSIFSCLRFSAAQGGTQNDPAGIAGSAETDWSTRQSPMGVGYAQAGLPWEDTVIFANTTGRDIWVCLPLDCTDDYILKALQLLKYGSRNVGGQYIPYTSQTNDPTTWTQGTTSWFPGLIPGRKVYFELSNEVWNYDGFGTSRANAYIAANGDVFHWQSQSPSILGNAWTGWRTVIMAILARQVWGTDVNGSDSTIRIVYANQGDQGGWSFHVDALNYINAIWGTASAYNSMGGYTNPKQPVSYYIHNLSGSFYVHHADGSGVPNTSTVGTLGTIGSAADGTGFLRQLKLSLSVDGGNGNLYEDSVYQRHGYGTTLAQQYGIKFSSYETGIEIFQYGSVQAAWQGVDMQTLYYNLLKHPSTLANHNADIMIQSATVRGVQPPNELSPSYTAAAGFPWPLTGTPASTRMWLAVLQVAAGQ
jgi:hypothetical protein